MNANIENGLLTIINEAGEHKTFKVHTCKRGNLKGKRIVSVLFGRDNVNDYSGFAFVVDNHLMVWRKKQNKRNIWYSKLIKEANKALRETDKDECQFTIELASGKVLKYTAKLSIKCRRCNRSLTAPESLDKSNGHYGLGPECAKMEGIR